MSSHFRVRSFPPIRQKNGEWMGHGDGTELERFSDRYTLTGLNKGGFFLRKNPLERNGSGIRQSENHYKRSKT